jgi:hypothetical protein
MLTALVWCATWMMLADERTLSATIPLNTHRWFIIDFSYHRLDVSGDSVDAQTFHELRVRAGTEDTATEHYEQYTDLTIPLWPLLPNDS